MQRLSKPFATVGEPNEEGLTVHISEDETVVALDTLKWKLVKLLDQEMLAVMGAKGTK